MLAAMSADDGVIYPNFPTLLDLPAACVLAAASEVHHDTLLVISKLDDGRLYFASTTGDCGEVMLLLKRAELHMLNMIESEAGS